VESDCYKNLTEILIANDRQYKEKNKLLAISVQARIKKKLEASRKSGSGLDDIYIPTLWYFNDLEFLRDQEEQVNSYDT
jgi:hypothetical protein